jgi:hypothetical protein
LDGAYAGTLFFLFLLDFPDSLLIEASRGVRGGFPLKAARTGGSTLFPFFG